jgi:DNA-binding MarR family transcriptional regulator
MGNSSPLEEDYILWRLLLETRDTVFKARQKELRRYGISPEEAAVLFVVKSLGAKATPTEISRYLLRKIHTVSGILSRMEKKRLLRKTKDLPRKNSVRASLTEKGEQAYYQSTKIESISGIMSSLSEQERQQFSSCLKTLRDRALKQLGIEQKRFFSQYQ